MNENSYFVLGVGGHAKVIVETARLLGMKIDGLYDDDPTTQGKEFFGLKVLGTILENVSGSGIIAIGNNEIRHKINNHLLGVTWKTMIHPSAIVSADAQIGEGTIIMAGAIVQPGVKIGKHCIVNTGSCVDHDCILEDFVHIAPNCSLAGAVHVKEGTLVGIGSTVIPNISIGKWSIIGAGSVVINHQPDHCTAFGNPAKQIKFKNEI